MNKIEELIEHLCPNGVVFKDIETLINNKSVSTITPPRKLTKNFYQTIGAIPIIDQGQDFIIGYTDNEEVIIDKGLYVIFGDHTEVFKYVDFPFAQGADGIKIIKTNPSVIVSKFLYYALNSYYIKTGKYTRHFSFLKKTFIPIPPLAIQQEIVSILDKFTTLAVNLKDELQARARQYEYYRNELLNFEGKEVEFFELQDVANYSKSRIPATVVDNTNYVGVDNLLQNKQGKTNSSYVPTLGNMTGYEIEDILIGNIRPYLKKIWWATNNGGTNGDVLVIRIHKENKNALSSRFLYYLLASDMFFDYNMQFAKGAKMPRGDKSAILRFKIAIPPLAEQERIVTILDKFDALVNDLSIGLPAEIKARRKQYEYYRGKLLDFKSISNG
jgi:type I restriction enzyme S subunit